MLDFLRGFVGALAGRLLAAEFYASIPVAAAWLLQQYVRFFPEGVGERLLEEWQADLEQFPGHLAKISYTLDIGLKLVWAKIEADLFEKAQQAKTPHGKTIHRRIKIILMNPLLVLVANELSLEIRNLWSSVKANTDEIPQKEGEDYRVNTFLENDGWVDKG